MDQIRKQVRIARRRLTTARFLDFLPWTLSIALLLALLGLALPKLMYMAVEPAWWFSSWLIGGALLALLITTILTLVGRPSGSDAAIEIDRRFSLRERLSSALLLAPEDRHTELGQALADDANRRASQLDIAEHFHWGASRALLVPLLPLLLAAGLWLVPNRGQPEGQPSAAGTSLNQVKNSTNPLLEQIKKKRLQAETQGLTAAVDMFKKLEGELAKLQKDTQLDTKQTLAKLNDIKQQLNERRKELGSAESLKKNLQNLEKFDAGPAEKLGEALKQGDFEKAEESLEKLLEKMRQGEMSPAELGQLQKQLEQLEQSMAEAAQAHQQAKQALQDQIRQAEAAGDMQKASQLQRKLDELQAQEANLASMQQMADALAQAQQAMKQGNPQAAQEALEQMASQLQQMNQSDAELQDLDQLLDSLAQSKSQMTCKQCSGQGCTSCMGKMPGQFPGMGMGEGRGMGERPEEETDADFFESRVRDQMKQGETVYGGKIGGDNRKGTTQSEVQDAVLSSLSEEPEPLDDTPLPKLQRDHTRDYFNTLRDGQP
ncbi:MAG: hypothetical protein KDA45_12635 [Planctomycetales bacterium]|nr:hypothetical protein [Planctomycetales bacterium]